MTVSATSEVADSNEWSGSGDGRGRRGCERTDGAQPVAGEVRGGRRARMDETERSRASRVWAAASVQAMWLLT